MLEYIVVIVKVVEGLKFCIFVVSEIIMCLVGFELFELVL